MPVLLRAWRWPRRESLPVQTSEDVRSEASGPTPAPAYRILLLIPTEGGLAFRPVPFVDVESLYAFIARDPSILHRRLVAFWMLHNTPEGQPGDLEGRAEAVVLVRAAGRDGVVLLHSFADMQVAQSFVRAKAASGLDLRNVLVYWATPLSLDGAGGGAAEPELEAAGPSDEEPISDDLAARAVPESREAASPVAVADAVRPARRAGGRGRRPAAGADGHGKQENSRVVQADPVDSEGAAEPGGIVAAIQSWPGWDGLAPLIGQALRLNKETYFDVMKDPSAVGRAYLIVSLGAVSAAIGSGGTDPRAFAAHLVAAVIGWAVFVFTAWALATHVFPARRPPGVRIRLVQVLGLASSPTLFLLLGAIPIYGPLFVIGAFVWLVPTTAVALPPALEIDSQSAEVSAAVACLLFFAVAQIAPMVLI